MADARSTPGSQGRSRINLGEGYEALYWSRKFGVSRERLAAAIEQVGDSVEAVERALSASRLAP
jgi:hypothetical protein